MPTNNTCPHSAVHHLTGDSICAQVVDRAPYLRVPHLSSVESVQGKNLHTDAVHEGTPVGPSGALRKYPEIGMGQSRNSRTVTEQTSARCVTII